MIVNKSNKLKKLITNLKFGFTLIEILIAIAVFSMFFIILINFFIDSLNKTDTANTQADNLRDARIALLHFEKDIREAYEILNFEDNPQYTNLQLKHKLTNDNFEYIIYTLYKEKQNIGGINIPFSLCRNVLKNEPNPTDVAITPLIKEVEKSSGQVGIIKKALDPISNTEVVSEIAAYNMHYDPSYLNIPFLSHEDKQKEKARARYNGKFNGSLVGFTDKSKIVAFEITILTNDQRNNISVYNSFIYNRKKFYDNLTDGNF